MSGYTEIGTHSSVADVKYKKHVNEKCLGESGLRLDNVSQIGAEVRFEAPVKLANTVCAGVVQISAFS